MIRSALWRSYPSFIPAIRTVVLAVLLPLCIHCPPLLQCQILYRQESGTPSHLYAVDFLDDSLGLAAGDNGTILRTTDGGAAWAPVPSGVTTSLRCLKWMSPSTALAAGFFGTVLRSTDTGLTWVPSVSGVAVPLDGCDAYDSLHAVVAGYGSIILVTADGGITWESRPNGVGSVQYYGATYADSLTIVVTGAGGRIVRSTDGGATWTWQLFGTASYNDVDFGDPLHGIAVGSGTFLRTADGGASWTPVPGGTCDDVEFASPLIGVAAGVGIYSSTTGGMLWGSRQPPVRLRSAAVFGAGDYLVVGDNGVILRTVSDIVTLPAPAPASPADGATDVPLSPESRKEFSAVFSWNDYKPYLADGIHLQISTDSTFATVDFHDRVTPSSSYTDTLRTVPYIFPGRTYFWRMRMAIEAFDGIGGGGYLYYSPWSEPRRFAATVSLNSRTIREIQEVSADSLLLADSLTEIARDRWTLQTSPLRGGTFFVTAVCVASASDLYDPLYWIQGALGPAFFIGVDTAAAPDSLWRGLKFTPEFLTADPGFINIRKGDLVVCSGRISEDPWDNMNSETALYVSWFFVLDSHRPLPPAVPATIPDFYFPGGQNQLVRYSAGEPLEGSIVELTNLTVHSVDVEANGTFNVTARDGLTMSTADFSRWFTLRSHRDPASAYQIPNVGRHIDTIRGAIVTTSGSGNSWSYPRYRIAPVSPGDIVFGSPAGTLLRGTVFYDSSRNGTQDPDEAGIPGWEIHLGGLVSALLATSADGSYQAAGLDSGRYTISFDLPAGWFVSIPGSLSIDTTLGIGDTVVLPPIGIYYGWNSISGTLFEDLDEDGVKGPGEYPLIGWTVFLSGDPPETTGVNPAGYYTFDRVPRGLFEVTAEIPLRWEQIVPFGSGGYDINFEGYDEHIGGRDFSLRRSPQRVKVAVTMKDGGEVARRDIFFGARAGASHAVWGVDSTSTNIDFSEGEFELPPQVYGLFDVRFVNPHGGWASYGEGTWTDIREYFSPAQIDTYRIDFQPGYFFGGSYPMRLFWSRAGVDSAYAGPVTLEDTSGVLFADMKAADSLIVGDTALGVLAIVAQGPVPRITGVSRPEGTLPSEFALFQNYPNPFNPSTLIDYALPLRTRVVLKLYDILGREVATLVNGTEGPGRYTVRWEPGRVPGGVYFCRLSAGGYAKTMKMLLVK